jgi:hypothetical protein
VRSTVLRDLAGPMPEGRYELWRNPDGVMVAAAGSFCECECRPAIFVVAHERHRPSDHRNNRALILFGQSVEKRRREREENDLLTDVRPLVFTGHQWSRF